MQATNEHCFVCFTTLHVYLGGTPPPASSATPVLDNRVGGVFVTWTETHNGALRGCVGSLAEIDLYKGLRDYAITSAVRDSRFNPISLKELPNLSCGVSILGNFEEGLKWNEWTVGIHGIIIRLELNGVKYSATYLPEVAPAQGWNVNQTLISLLAKAGVAKKSIHEAMFDKIVLTRYQSSKAQVTYAQWQSAVMMMMQGKR